jgi:hypothetical protein
MRIRSIQSRSKAKKCGGKRWNRRQADLQRWPFDGGTKLTRAEFGLIAHYVRKAQDFMRKQGERDLGRTVWNRPQDIDRCRRLRLSGVSEHRESDMISEMQVHVIARQMLEKHGPGAIAEAAQNALACESKGDTEDAKEWRHIEDAMKMMRGPHQS